MSKFFSLIKHLQLLFSLFSYQKSTFQGLGLPCPLPPPVSISPRLRTAVKWTAMDNSATDLSPSVSTEGGRGNEWAWEPFGGGVGVQMETLKVRETQPPHKATLAVTESDGHLPPFYRHHPFLPSSLLKSRTFPGAAVKRNISAGPCPATGWCMDPDITSGFVMGTVERN